MNFKLSILIVFLLFGCGVKDVPKVKENEAINSFLNKYKTEKEKSYDEELKKKKARK